MKNQNVLRRSDWNGEYDGKEFGEDGDLAREGQNSINGIQDEEYWKRGEMMRPK
jgi:hypothetical protein